MQFFPPSLPFPPGELTLASGLSIQRSFRPSSLFSHRPHDAQSCGWEGGGVSVKTVFVKEFSRKFRRFYFRFYCSGATTGCFCRRLRRRRQSFTSFRPLLPLKFRMTMRERQLLLQLLRFFFFLMRWNEKGLLFVVKGTCGFVLVCPLMKKGSGALLPLPRFNCSPHY